METTTIEHQNLMPQNERPQFLSVLCILTWLACGYMFISSALSMLTPASAETQEESIEQVEKLYGSDVAEQMEELYANQDSPVFIAGNAISLIALGISAFGAALMWQLKRKGFFVYVAGELIQYTSIFIMGSASFAVFGAMINMSASAFMGITIAACLVFDIVFFAMYGANLKHMKD